MQLFSTFEHGTSLEMAIATLEKKGIKREKIYIIPLVIGKRSISCSMV